MAPDQNPTTEPALSDYERGYHDGVTVAAEDIKRLRALVEKLESEILGAEYENGHRR